MVPSPGKRGEFLSAFPSFVNFLDLLTAFHSLTTGSIVVLLIVCIFYIIGSFEPLNIPSV